MFQKSIRKDGQLPEEYNYLNKGVKRSLFSTGIGLIEKSEKIVSQEGLSLPPIQNYNSNSENSVSKSSLNTIMVRGNYKSQRENYIRRNENITKL
jgi:hypothetical protein